MMEDTTTLNSGQFFSSKKKCTSYIENIALRKGKRAVLDVKPSGGKFFRLVSSSTTMCSFHINISKTRGITSGYVIGTFNLDHIGLR